MGRSNLKDYRDRYRNVRFERNDGVLEVALHSDGDSLIWGVGVHNELPDAFADIAADAENRVVLLTGTGRAFCERADSSLMELTSTAGGWGRVHIEGVGMLEQLLRIPVPVIAAVNGPARVHAELAVLSDVVLAAEHTVFQDLVHIRFGMVPGDGVHAVWPFLLGPNRGRYFLLTAEKIDAAEARRLGVVGEVLPAEALMPRARELAASLAELPLSVLRRTRDVLTHRLRREVLEAASHGLALEGLAALEALEEKNDERAGA